MFAAVVAMVMALSACSSSGSNDTGGGGANTAPGVSLGGSALSGSKGIVEAKAFVAKYAQRPTTIPVKVPVGAPVPKGKTVYFISCGTPECSEESDIIKQGTDALGWTL